VVEKRYYSLNLTGLSNGREKFDSENYKVVIDSGTSLIVGPHHLIRPMLEHIVVEPDCSELDKLPTISFEIDGVEYKLEPNDYVLRISHSGQEECAVALMSATMPESFKYIILGDVFMRRYYSYFDRNQDRVGFIDVQKLTTIE